MEPSVLAKAATRRKSWTKRITVVILFALLIAAFITWFNSDVGTKLRDDPRILSADVRRFIGRHPVTAPAAYVVTYVMLALLAMPIWWLQILAGVGFGLYEGTLLSLIASTVGAAATVVMSRWLAGDWFHDRIEGQMEKLAKLSDTLGHNGLLLVMSVRLTHVLPFGLCNYAIGLTRVSYRDVILGTFLGNIPAVALYVGAGAHYKVLQNWKFDSAVATINIVLLLPLILRYLRPEWFKKIGVE